MSTGSVGNKLGESPIKTISTYSIAPAKLAEMESYRSVRRFRERWLSAGRSKDKYLRRVSDLSMFCNLLNRTPDQLAELRSKDELLDAFRIIVRRRGPSVSRRTMQEYLSRLRVFLIANDVEEARSINPSMVMREYYGETDWDREVRSQAEKRRLLEEFRKRETIDWWWRDCEAGEKTKRVYLGMLHEFCQWAGMTPEELIEERRRAMEGWRRESLNIRPPPRHAEHRLKGFMEHLKTERKLSPSRRLRYRSAVRSFYEAFGVPLKPKSARVRYRKTWEGARAATKEEIREMLEVTMNPRDRALILFMAHTGIAADDIGKIRVGDLGKREGRLGRFNFEDLNGPALSCWISRGKTGVEYKTFVSCEALDAVKRMLRFRRDGLKGWAYDRGASLKEEITEHSILFAGSSWEGGERKQSGLKSPIVSRIVRNAAKRAGIWTPGFSSHALRRYFQTTLERSKAVPKNWVMHMMGHKLPGVEASYSDALLPDLKVAYAEAEPTLYIQEGYTAPNRVKRLERELEDAKQREMEMLESLRKLDELYEEVEKLKEMVKAQP